MANTIKSVELSIIVPVYNEAANIPVLLDRLAAILPSVSEDYEVVFVADPSTDGTEELLAAAHKRDPRIAYVVLSRRFGQPAATLAGLDLARGRAAVIMDADLQDPPELIEELVSRWRHGDQVVYAQRRSRKGETAIKRLVSGVGYHFMNRFSEVPIPRNVGDFRLLDRKVIETIRRFPESNGFLRGLTALAGFRQSAVTFDRPARHSGRGNYNRFFGSIRIGLNGVICYSTVLLDVSTWAGLLSFGCGAVVGVVRLITLVLGVRFLTGEAAIVIIVLLLGGLQLLCLGIAGQYVGRIYEEVKRRPRYIIAHGEGVFALGDVTEPGLSSG